jgi:hypothetical protein
MMTSASASSVRGSLDAWSDEDIAIAIDAETEHVSAIREAMQGKTLDGDRLSGWEKRQPKREDGAAERAAAWREQKRLEKDELELSKAQPNATERAPKIENAPKPPEEKRVEIDSPDRFLPYDQELSISEKSTEEVKDPPVCKKRKNPFPNNAFEAWWSVYPDKIGKGAAKQSFEKVYKSDAVAFDELTGGVERYKRFKPADRAWCNPKTWLNQSRWQDEWGQAGDRQSVTAPKAAPVDSEPRIPLPGGNSWPEQAVISCLKKFRTDRRSWPDILGFPPGHPSCVIPAALIAEHVGAADRTMAGR